MNCTGAIQTTVLAALLSFGGYRAIGQVLTEPFNTTPFPPSGWVLLNNGSGNDWARDSVGSFEGPGVMVYLRNNTYDADAWAFTPAITMTKDAIYRVEFYQNTFPGYQERLKVTIGTDPTVSAQTTVLFNSTSLTNTSYVKRVTADYTCPASGTYYVAFNCYSLAFHGNLYVDYVRVFETVPGPMTFVACTTSQNDTGFVYRDSSNQQIIGIEVVTRGTTSPLHLTQLAFNTGGTTYSANIAGARVFYTGNSAFFDTTRSFGTAVISPWGTFSVAGDTVLASNTNYFWLAYRVGASAIVGSVLDAQCTGASLGGAGTMTPTVVNPSGSRPIWDVNYGGGPLAGGYYFANSTPAASGAPSRPAYNWIVERTYSAYPSGGFDDGYEGPIPLDFSFPFFGTSYTQLYICTNGFLSFGPTPPPVNVYGGSLPGLRQPTAFVAPCMMDLRLDDPDSYIEFGGDANRFVVTFTHARDASTFFTTYVTFQVALYSNGNILFQYNDTASTIPPPLNFTQFALVGIEDGTGTVGYQYRNNGRGGPMYGSPLAVMFGTTQGLLPVELVSLDATASTRGKGTFLSWSTLSEVNNFGFEVERSRDRDKCYCIVSPLIHGHGTTLIAHRYSFEDSTASPGTWYYRLRQTDLDRTVHTSDPISIQLQGQGEPAFAGFSLLQNYPNPFNASTQIRFTVEKSERTTLVVYNVIGQGVTTLFDGVAEAGREYVVKCDGGSLASGLYFYRLTNGTRTEYRKMMLVR